MKEQFIDAVLCGQLLALLGFTLVYAVVQFPFDLTGGYFLPNRYGRTHLPWGRFIAELSRAILTHGTLLFLIAALFLFAGIAADVTGTVTVGMIIMIFLLLGRVGLASLIAPLELTAGSNQGHHEQGWLYYSNFIVRRPNRFGNHEPIATKADVIGLTLSAAYIDCFWPVLAFGTVQYSPDYMPTDHSH